MITHNFNTLDLLTSPVWIVSPFEEQLIYANSAARLLMQDLTFSQLRTGPYSVSSQKELPKYLSDLQNQHDIIEILTVQSTPGQTDRNSIQPAWRSVRYPPYGSSACTSPGWYRYRSTL